MDCGGCDVSKRMNLPDSIVIMGVSGAGKSEVGQALARLLQAVYSDADDFHSAEAKAKMRQGIPLTDEDRWPWLRRLREHLLNTRAEGRRVVLACSALRAVYRDLLRGDDTAAQMRFVLLDGPRDLIAQRIGARQGHYMPPTLLDSQLATLERTPDLLVTSIAPPPEAIAEAIRSLLLTEAEA